MSSLSTGNEGASCTLRTLSPLFKAMERMFSTKFLLSLPNAATAGNVIGVHARSPPVIGEAKNCILVAWESSFVVSV